MCTAATDKKGPAMTRTTFTDRPYQRSWGKAPRGYGGWAFQEATSHTAYSNELVGEVAIFTGTLTEAKALAASHFPNARIVAVLG